MPAVDAQIPNSTSACASTSTSRAEYGAPEAPVMPRKTRTSRRLLGALGFAQEDAELMQLHVSERRELRHHVVAGLRRVGDVRREKLRSLAALADRREVGRAEVRATGAEIRVAGGAAGAGEDRRACDRVLVVSETLALR